MLVSIPPYISIAQFMGYLKGKSTLMIFDRHANLKYKYGSSNFWCRGYYVDTVGRNKKVIEENIRNQLEEDYATDQTSIKEFTDPFTGSKNKSEVSKEGTDASAKIKEAEETKDVPETKEILYRLINSGVISEEISDLLSELANVICENSFTAL